MLISFGAPSAMYSRKIFEKDKNCSSSPQGCSRPLRLCRPSALLLSSASVPLPPSRPSSLSSATTAASTSPKPRT